MKRPRVYPVVVGVAVVCLAGALPVGAGTLKCPADSVKVGNVCIDLYEASVWQIAPSNTKLVKKVLDRLAQPVRDRHGRAARAFHPAASTDLTLFAAVLRGEHLRQGFRNRALRLRRFGPAAATDHLRAAHVSRLLKRLHLRGLLAKIPRSHRWRVPQLGHVLMSTAVLLREEHFPSAFLKDAA